MKIKLLAKSLIIFVLMTVSVNAQTHLAPFLYYYSEENHAFIIERADGSDLLVFADYMLPEDHYIWGAGWSPSANWFAWTSSTIDKSTSQFDYTISIANLNGDLVTLNTEGHTLDMAWSPTDDLLMIKLLDAERDNLAIIRVIEILV